MYFTMQNSRSLKEAFDSYYGSFVILKFSRPVNRQDFQRKSSSAAVYQTRELSSWASDNRT